MIRVGIIGGAGYTAGELIRLLVNHPQAEIAFVHSTSNAGNRLAQVHGGLEGDTGMRFCDAYDLGAIDVLFLCSAHGQSRVWMEENTIPAGVKIIDLAQDFRDESCGFVYGLPELNRERIRRAERVANPGCFATAIQLALLPLAAAGLLQDEAHVTAVTGSTGAGVKPSATTHFSWRSDEHFGLQGLHAPASPEIGRNLRLLEPSFDREVNFVPMRGDFTRGILASVYTACPLDGEAASKLYADFYAPSAFTRVTERDVDLKQVVNTNKALLHTAKLRRETARRLGHRQPAERGVGTGRAEHEPDVRAGRKGGFAAESLGILIRTGVIHGVPPWFALPFGGNRRTQHEQRPLAGYAVPEGGKRAQRS
ncbi:MAG: N-acetyl-gamma-glutamyl-phosphate reductase [Alistipes shahii]